MISRFGGVEGQVLLLKELATQAANWDSNNDSNHANKNGIENSNGLSLSLPKHETERILPNQKTIFDIMDNVNLEFLRFLKENGVENYREITALLNDFMENKHLSLTKITDTQPQRSVTEATLVSPTGVSLTSAGITKPSKANASNAPKTWEEAKIKAGLIGINLKSWSEYKLTYPNRSIVDYLGDNENGLGEWTLKPPGIPRHTLQNLHPVANPEKPEVGSPYKALENWIAYNKKVKTRENPLPTHLHVPVISEEIDHLATQDMLAGREPTARVDAALRARTRRATRASR